MIELFCVCVFGFLLGSFVWIMYICSKDDSYYAGYIHGLEEGRKFK